MKFIIKVKFNYLGITVYQYLETKLGTQLEKIKKKLQRLFKKYDLEITAEGNQKTVNYQDVTLNLKDGTCRPYQKLDGKTKYIIIHKAITRQIFLNIYRSLQKVVNQTYPLPKSYSKNQQQTTKIICDNLGKKRN